MSNIKNKQRANEAEALSHSYNGSAYKKPRNMKPRNMTQDATDNFTAGHVKKVHKVQKKK